MSFCVATLRMHRIRVISVACGKEHTVALGDQGKVMGSKDGDDLGGMLSCGDIVGIVLCGDITTHRGFV